MNLTVTDLNRSVDWYLQTFGLAVIGDEEAVVPATDEPMRYRSLGSPETMSYVVGLIEHDLGTSERFDERRPGLDHVALHVPEASDLEAWAEHLDVLGVEHSGIKTTPYASCITLRDPDGIQLELFLPNLDFWAQRFLKAAERRSHD